VSIGIELHPVDDRTPTGHYRLPCAYGLDIGLDIGDAVTIVWCIDYGTVTPSIIVARETDGRLLALPLK
jgi:hypothetical protein